MIYNINDQEIAEYELEKKNMGNFAFYERSYQVLNTLENQKRSALDKLAESKRKLKSAMTMLKNKQEYDEIALEIAKYPTRKHSSELNKLFSQIDDKLMNFQYSSST